MEGQSPHYLPYDGAHSPYGPPRPQRGCLFYGCLVAVVLGVLVAILIGVGAFSVLRYVNKLVDEYAEDAPRPVLVASLPGDQLEALKARVKAFGDDLAEGKPVEPMALTADEINALIDTNPDLKGVIAVDLTGDKLGGQLSLPLDRLNFPGRYLNGAGTFAVRIADDGRLFVTVQTLEVKGKPVPQAFLEAMRKDDVVKTKVDDPGSRRSLRGIDHVEVKGGRLIVFPKVRPASGAEPEPAEEGEPGPAEKAGSKAAEKPEPAPKPEDRPARKEPEPAPSAEKPAVKGPSS